jgi:hypothetical protein
VLVAFRIISYTQYVSISTIKNTSVSVLNTADVGVSLNHLKFHLLDVLGDIYQFHPVAQSVLLVRSSLVIAGYQQIAIIE